MKKAKDISIPTRFIGPVKFTGDVVDEVSVPLSTFETPLWPSTNRGAKVSRLSGGVQVTLIQDFMARSIIVEASSGAKAVIVSKEIEKRKNDIKEVVEKTTNHGKFEDITTRIVGKLLFIRLTISTGNASGHNMVTKAADALIDWVIKKHDVEYVSISGNYCTDKKVSAVNSILGRGKSVVAEMIVKKDVCKDVLKTTPKKINDLNIKKNLIGSLISGSVASANAHFANILLGFYLSTGQDAANIVEGSQGIVQTELINDDLYISATIPNIIVGTLGNGKHHDFIKDNLNEIGCLENNESENSKRLACLIAGTALCGELSLLAAQTNPGELMRSHIAFERREAI